MRQMNNHVIQNRDNLSMSIICWSYHEWILDFPCRNVQIVYENVLLSMTIIWQWWIKSEVSQLEKKCVPYNWTTKTSVSKLAFVERMKKNRKIFFMTIFCVQIYFFFFLKLKSILNDSGRSETAVDWWTDIQTWNTNVSVLGKRKT